VSYSLVAELRRMPRLCLLPDFPDPVFAAVAAREASRRLGLSEVACGSSS
jgi:hypothetical protein